MDQWVYFNFADFSGTADFSDIDKITVTVDGTSGADITIDDIESSAIPEPNTASLLLLIGLGLCGTIRRKLV